MTLFSPWWWLLLIPALIWLWWHAKHPHTKAVSSLLFWQASPEHLALRRASRARWHPRQFLWLLALLGLLLALSQPVRVQQGLADHIVLIIDSSLAMQAGEYDTAFTQTKQDASELLRAWWHAQSGPKHISLLRTTGTPYLLAARLPSLSEGLAVLDAQVATDIPLHDSWSEWLKRIQPLIAPLEHTQIVLLHNGQLQAPPENLLSTNAEIWQAVTWRDHQQAVPSQPNTALKLISFQYEDEHWNAQLQLTTDARSDSPLTLHTYVQTPTTSTPLLWHKTDVPLLTPNTPKEITLALDLPPRAVLTWQLYQGDTLLQDRLHQDNTITAPLPVTRRILLVGKPEDTAASARALAALPRVTLERTTALPPDTQNYHLLVLHQLTLNSYPNSPFLCFACRFTAESSAAPSNSELRYWHPQHPLTQGLSWQSLRPTLSRLLEHRPYDITLLADADEQPFMLLRPATDQYPLHLRTSFTPEASSWKTQLSFPIFLARLIDLIQPSHTGCPLAQPCALPLDSTALISPLGKSIPLTPSLYGMAFTPEHVGLYTAQTPRGDVAIGAQLPVDSPSPMLPVPTDALADLKPPLHLWRWILLGALLLLVVDAVLEWRTVGYIRRAQWGFLALLGCVAIGALAQVVVPVPKLVPRPPLAALYDSTVPDQQQAITALKSRLPLIDITYSPSCPTPNPEAALCCAACTVGEALELAQATSAHHHLLLGDTFLSLSPTSLNLNGTTILANPDAAEASLLLSESVHNITPNTRATLAFTLHHNRQETLITRVLQGEQEIFTQPLEVSPGYNYQELSLPPENAANPLPLTLSINAKDSILSNNTATLSAQPQTTLHHLIISPETHTTFETALTQQGIVVDSLTPDTLPTTYDDLLVTLSAYRSISLINTPAEALNADQLEGLKTFVSDGGGLLMAGLGKAFGPGGYLGTVLEHLSPLSSRISEDVPRVAMLFILDRSGSMEKLVPSGINEQTQLLSASSAIVNALPLLPPQSLVGVIAFDEITTALIPLAPLISNTTAAHIAARLSTLAPGGGTDLQPALIEALTQITTLPPEQNASSKHVLVLSDGLSQPGDFARAVARLRAAGVTVSVIALGERADVHQLQNIAHYGGGAYHHTQDARDLPSIISREALLLSVDPLARGAFTPTKAPITTLTPAALASWPLDPLKAYVRTSVKDEATPLLMATEREPLAAIWHYGLGTVLAYAAQPWQNQQNLDYAHAWSQLVRDITPVMKDTPPQHVTHVTLGDLNAKAQLSYWTDHQATHVTQAQQVSAPSWYWRSPAPAFAQEMSRLLWLLLALLVWGFWCAYARLWRQGPLT